MNHLKRAEAWAKTAETEALRPETEASPYALNLSLAMVQMHVNLLNARSVAAGMRAVKR
jgi:hypothetical protein